MEIINDHSSGSEKLTEKVLSFVKKRYEIGEEWKKYKNKIINAHREMVQIKNVLDLIDFLGEERIDEINLKIKELKERAIKNSRKLFHGKIRLMTISYSSLVYGSIMENKDKIIQVNVLESGPGYEGITLSRDLNKEGIKTKLFGDVQIYHALKDCDMVLVGFDAIDSKLSIINKTGTFPLASSSKILGIPFYSIGTSIKYAYVKINFKKYNEKFLFDETPSFLISGFILDPGFFGRRKFSDLSGIISRKDFLKNLFVNGE